MSEGPVWLHDGPHGRVLDPPLIVSAVGTWTGCPPSPRRWLLDPLLVLSYTRGVIGGRVPLRAGARIGGVMCLAHSSPATVLH